MVQWEASKEPAGQADAGSSRPACSWPDASSPELPVVMTESGDPKRAPLGESELNSLVTAVAEHACRASFSRLYELTSSRLFGIIHRIIQDLGEAEEVLQ